LKNILFSLILLVSCNNGKIKSNNSAAISPAPTRNASQDTSSLGLKIGEHEYDKLEKLKIEKRNAYAQVALKQFTFCNCMSQSLRHDSIYMNEDVSNGILATDFVIHEHDVLDSIKKIVKEYLLPPTTVIDSGIKYKNHSYRCLTLYNSDYLDSVVRSYDKKIITEN